MVTRLRLARHGTKKSPFYWVVAANSTSPRDGSFIEKLGTYNPLLEKENPERVKLNKERISHWLSVGAVPSETSEKLFEISGIELPKKIRSAKNSRDAIRAAKLEKIKAEKALKEKEEAELKAKEESTIGQEN